MQYLGTPATEGVLSWKQLLEIGEKEEETELEERLKSVAINQCCHLVYTSGKIKQSFTIKIVAFNDLKIF